MARKKKLDGAEVQETREDKLKPTKKRKSAKKVEEVAAIPVEETSKPEFQLSEIINWTDEECTEKDKVLKFTVADMRDILKALAAKNQEVLAVTEKLNLLKSTISKGLMTGYTIICPHCGRKYMVSSTELNRKDTVMCKVCGTEYKENEHISGIAFDSEKDEVVLV